MKRALAAIVLSAIVLSSATASADDSVEAKTHFNRGVKLYNLGHFQEAIPEFEKAYDLDPAPILLFNIAQSHRQNGNKERALFFYRRYLEQEPNADKRADVEQRMKELAQSLQQENEQKQKPPTEVSPPPSVPSTPRTEPSPAVPPPVVVTTPAPPPPLGEPSPPWQVALGIGPAFIGFSGKDISAPVLLGFQLGGSYQFLRGPSELRAGLTVVFASLGYTNVSTGAKQNSSLWGGLLTADYAYRVAAPLRLGAGIGLGVIWWDNLAAGNPFTVASVAASGPIPMPTLALTLHADYLITPHLFVSLTPELLLSETTSAGLSDSVSSVHRFDLSLGVGYLF